MMALPPLLGLSAERMRALSRAFSPSLSSHIYIVLLIDLLPQPLSSCSIFRKSGVFLVCFLSYHNSISEETFL